MQCCTMLEEFNQYFTFKINLVNEPESFNILKNIMEDGFNKRFAMPMYCSALGVYLNTGRILLSNSQL